MLESAAVALSVITAVALLHFVLTRRWSGAREPQRGERHLRHSSRQRFGAARLGVVGAMFAGSAAIGVATQARPHVAGQRVELPASPALMKGAELSAAPTTVPGKSASLLFPMLSLAAPSFSLAPNIAMVYDASVLAPLAPRHSSVEATLDVYSLTVTPLLPSASAQQYSSGAANYQVTNTSTAGAMPLVVNFAVGGCMIGNIYNCPAPQPVMLSPGQSTTVWVTFTAAYITPSPEPLVLAATASAPDGTSPSSSAVVGVSVIAPSFPPPGPTISVTPYPSTSSTQQWTAGTASYIVQNTSTGGGTPSVFFLVSGIQPANICCVQNPSPISLPPGAAQVVSITYQGMNPTTSPVALTLTANAGPVSASGTVNISVTGYPSPPFPVYAIKVTAVDTISSVAEWSQGTATYLVQNTSTNTNSQLAINLAVSGCSGSIWCGGYVPNVIFLQEGTSQLVPVTYNGNQVTSSPVALSLTGTASAPGGMLSSAATVRVSVNGPPPPPPSVFPGPPASTPVTIMRAGGGLMSFNVQSYGLTAETITYSVNCGGLASCGAWPGTQTLGANASSTQWIYFSANPNQSGTFTVSLTATGRGGSSTATGQVIVDPPQPSYSISVTPNPATASTQLGTTGFASYTIRNTSTNSTFALPISFAVSGCTSNISPCGAAPAPIALAQGASQNVSLSFRGTALTSTAALSLTGSSAYTSSKTGTVTISVTQPPPTYAITVTPNPNTSTTPQGTSGTANYTIQNTSTYSTIPLTISFSVSGCAGYITSCSAPSAITLSQGASQSVQVGYYGAITTSPASVALTLTGSTSYTSAMSGSVNVTITQPQLPPTFIAAVPAGPFPNGAIARDACLTISAGESAAYECGALRVVHALPTTSTYGKARTPTLLYNGSHAAPGAIVAVDVAVTGTQPTSIQANLSLGTGVSRTFSWNTAWTPGQKRRLSIPFDAVTVTNGTDPVLLPYTLELKAYVAGGVTGQSTMNGTVAIVDRRNSPFGAGWWLGGLERFVSIDGTHKLWVGGDGSTRVYTQQPSTNNWFVTPALSRPDLLEFIPNLSVWRRNLPNGAYVEFDNGGQHTKTRDAFGRFTTFNYVTSFGRTVLQSVQLPVLAGAIPTYSFAYGPDNSGFPRLSTVTAPPSNVSRIVTVGASSGPVTFIRDPAGDTTFFVTSGLRLTKRINKLKDTTTFAYDEAGQLRSASVDMRRTGGVAAPFITQSFCAAESRSVTSCGGGVVNTPTLTSNAYTLLVGARTLDSTIFFVNGFGAPDTIVNALGQKTRVIRDATFPLLASTVIKADGFTTVATFNSRGLPTAVTALSPYGTGNDTTRYYWNATWNEADSVVTSGNVAAITRYDLNYPMPLWHEDRRGATSRTSFTYTIPGLVDAVFLPPNPQGVQETPTRLHYDAFLANLDSTLSPKGFGTGIQRDAIGRVQQVLSPIDVAGTLRATSLKFYDIAGRDSVTRTIGPAMSTAPAKTATVTTLYDKEGRPTSVTRVSSPDVTGTMVSSWRYDGLGRVVATIAPDGQKDSTHYDPSGNADALVTRRGPSITMIYDALNRLLYRTVPSVNYPAETVGIGTRYDPQPIPYPRIPNNGSAYLIATRVDSFTYTLGGQLNTATNQDARVTRAYWPNGQLKDEILELRNADPASTAAWHSYTTHNDYRIDGKRSRLALPAQLTGTAGNAITYSYADTTGDLKTIIDPLGFTYTYSYTLRGEPALLTFPGQYDQRWSYDAEGNVATDSLVNTGSLINRRWPAHYMRATAMQYDARGKRTASQDALGYQDVFTGAYDGIGQLVSSQLTQIGQIVGVAGSSSRYGTTETLVYDALGNISSGTTQDAANFYAPNTSYKRNNTRNRITTYQPTVGRVLSEATAAGTKTYRYDAAGNVEFVSLVGNSQNPAEDRFTYYSIDGQIRAADYRYVQVGNADITPTKSVFEEYRYDALGRRVWVRSYRNCSNYLNTDISYNADCLGSVVRRTIWDGTQELIEIQVRGDAAQTATTLENDDSQVAVPRVNGIDPNPFYGRVLYVHGLRTDQPIAVVRYNYIDNFYSRPSPTYFPISALSLFWNARGQLTQAACGLGTDTCIWNNYDMGYDLPAAWFAYDRPKFEEKTFQGTLLHDKQDAVQTLYRRNRSYDPQTGRFTQEDPIGLAGGMNLYGFSSGDPINFADPLGLCPKAAGGDGKTDGYADCPEGSSGYYAQRAALGRGGVVNDIRGAAAWCGEHVACGAAAAGASAIVGGWLVEGAGALVGALGGGAALSGSAGLLIPEGEALLVIVKDGKVIKQTANIALSHARLVEQTFGATGLPQGAWVGTIGKIGGKVAALNSRTFFMNQLPASAEIQALARTLFR